MLKIISATLLAASLLAAPALAATKSATAPAAKSVQVKSGVLNANAKMGRHHQRHHVRHHHHKRMGAAKAHQFSKATIKHVAPATKRG